MDQLEDFGSELDHLLADLKGLDMYSFSWGSITPYSFWIIITLILIFLLVYLLQKQVSFIPKTGPAVVLEVVVDYLRKEIGDGLLGGHGQQHMPFLLSLFFVILFSNLMGLVPGAKSATGTMSVTIALALCSFGYFNYAGAKQAGLGRYILHIAPAGLPPGVNVMVWLIEAFSMTLRIATLSIRLFINMFAGHLVLGCFALLSSLFALPMIEHFTLNSLLTAGVPAFGWILMMLPVYALELFVAFIQAYVFTLLSGVYIMLATSEH
ncbi:MAG: F0F1 ATP synthase subunit A [Coriobacteriia bacterium]|nr:F0F1 ATP synthase subunit A [Coriobacteriia bacterium]